MNLKDLIINAKFGEVGVSNAKVTTDNVGIVARPYDRLFKDLLNAQLTAVNDMLRSGFDIKTLDPNLNMLANMFKITVTPNQQDGFIYAGLTYAFDNSAKWTQEDMDRATADLMDNLKF